MRKVGWALAYRFDNGGASPTLQSKIGLLELSSLRKQGSKSAEVLMDSRLRGNDIVDDGGASPTLQQKGTNDERKGFVSIC
jgi:hypothetical protein